MDAETNLRPMPDSSVKDSHGECRVGGGDATKISQFFPPKRSRLSHGGGGIVIGHTHHE